MKTQTEYLRSLTGNRPRQLLWIGSAILFGIIGEVSDVSTDAKFLAATLFVVGYLLSGEKL